VTLVTTSSKFELVGRSSLVAAPRMVDAEGSSTSSVVARLLLPGSKGLTVTSADGMAMVGIDAEKPTSSVEVGSLVSVGTKLSSLTTADKLSATPKEVTILDTSAVTLSTILVSLPKIVELGIFSTSEANGVSIKEVAESTSLSSG